MVINDAWNGKEPNWKKAKQNGWSESEYLTWRAIIGIIPREWRTKLKESGQNLEMETNMRKIAIDGTLPCDRLKFKNDLFQID